MRNCIKTIHNQMQFLCQSVLCSFSWLFSRRKKTMLFLTFSEVWGNELCKRFFHFFVVRWLQCFNHYFWANWCCCLLVWHRHPNGGQSKPPASHEMPENSQLLHLIWILLLQLIRTNALSILALFKMDYTSNEMHLF